MKRIAFATLLVCALEACDSQPAGPDYILDMRTLAGPTATLPTLEPALSAEETRALRDGFSWETAPTVPERNADGHPTLWYVMVYLEDRDQVEALRQLDIHSSFVPLFAEERERWRGQSGVFTLEGDGRGVFAFAYMPGVLVNTARDLAVAGTPLFGAVIQRDIPVASARSSDGSLSYQWLLDEGFVYGGDSSGAPPPESGLGVGLVEAPFIQETVRAAASVTEDTIDELRRFFGDVSASADGWATVQVRTQVYTADPDFGSPNTQMFRSWGFQGSPVDFPDGPRMRDVLSIQEANIQAHRGGCLYGSRTNRRGFAQFRVSRGEMNLCVELLNYSGEVTNFMTALVVCNFAGEVPGFDDRGARVDAFVPMPDGGPPVDAAAVDGSTDAGIDGGALDWIQRSSDVHLIIRGDTRIVMRILDHRVNIFAQMTDGSDFMRWVMGYTPRQMRVLTGFYADIVGEFQRAGGMNPRAFALCNSYELNFRHFAMTHFLAPTSLFAAPIIDADIAYPYGEYDNANPFSASPGRGWHTHSRVVPTHEYGHTVMCDSMYNQDIGDEMVAILEIGISPQNPNDENAYVAEALADLIPALMMNGTNYAAPAGSIGSTTGSFCQPTTPVGTTGLAPVTCLELNTTSTRDGAGRTFRQQVEWIVTIFIDAFDGHHGAPPTLAGFPDSRATLVDGTGALSTRPLATFDDAGDEEIALPGHAWYSFWRNWSEHSSVLTVSTAMDALARTMLDFGFSSRQICDLFALHTPTGDCRDLVSDDALGYSSVQPSSPFAFRVSRSSAFPREVTFSWHDASPIATAYMLDVVSDDGDTVMRTVPYARSATSRETVRPNSWHTATLRTLNGTTASDPVALDFVTFSEPVTDLRVTPRPGALEIGWTPPASRIDGVRVRMTSPFRRVVAETTDSSVVIPGLSSSLAYVFEVRTLNQAGEESIPRGVLMAPTSPLPSREVYVATFGADVAGAGTPSLPFRTLGAAVTAATASGADTIRVATGVYVEPSPISISADVVIMGGFDADVTGWPEEATGTSEIQFSSALAFDLAAVSMPAFNPTGRRSRAALEISGGAHVTLRDLAVRYARAGAPLTSVCEATLHGVGSTIEMDSTSVQLDMPVSTGGCAAAVLLSNTELRAFDSTIEALSAGTQMIANDVDLAAIASRGTAGLRFENSTIIGANAASGSAPRSISGLATAGSAAVTLSQSRVLTTRDVTYTFTSGDIFALFDELGGADRGLA